MIQKNLKPCPYCNGLPTKVEGTATDSGSTGPIFICCRNTDCSIQPRVTSKKVESTLVIWDTIATM